MTPMETSTHFTIGAVARRASVGIDTVRYYERRGLLPEPQRREYLDRPAPARVTALHGPPAGSDI